MNIIDGKEIAKKLREKIAEEVKTLERPPGLAVILVGEDPASAVYVRNKELACIEAGFFSDKIIKSENTTEEQLLEEVERLNNTLILMVFWFNCHFQVISMLTKL